MTKTGKFGLMAGAAAIAMMAGAMGPAAAQDQSAVASNAELQQRIEALEAEVQQSEINAAQAANNPPPAPTGWWSNTSISGRMYFDASNIENKSNGVKVSSATNATSGATNGNGTGFDMKRFYVSVDHTFDSMFSADVTTDTTYDGTTGAGQIYIKKAYLQAKIDPALIVRLGAADLPWVPYVEGIYGYRYLENVMIDRTKFGTSSDWGVHALGSLFDGVLNYDVAAVNGGGYKKTPIGSDVNRFNTVDFEGRVNVVYDGFNVGVGGYTGKLGAAYGTTTFHTAQRLDAIASYNDGAGLRLGVEYFNANDYTAVTKTAPDAAHGISGFGSYYFLPQFAVFGRYEDVKPNTKTSPLLEDTYYNLGITWTPTKIVDFSLTYKHDDASHGSISTSNGTIGGSTKGSYNEIGLFGDFQW